MLKMVNEALIYQDKHLDVTLVPIYVISYHLEFWLQVRNMDIQKDGICLIVVLVLCWCGNTYKYVV